MGQRSLHFLQRIELPPPGVEDVLAVHESEHYYSEVEVVEWCPLEER